MFNNIIVNGKSAKMKNIQSVDETIALHVLLLKKEKKGKSNICTDFDLNVCPFVNNFWRRQNHRAFSSWYLYRQSPLHFVLANFFLSFWKLVVNNKVCSWSYGHWDLCALQERKKCTFMCQMLRELYPNPYILYVYFTIYWT